MEESIEYARNPGSEIKRLNFLVGNWHSEGEVRENSSNRPVRIIGTEIYEWVLGGLFILHRVDVRIGEEKVEAIEIIGGYDAASKTYPMRSFDNQGNFTTMEARIEQDGVMKITGDSMRSTLTVSNDGNHMTANWERSENDGTWKLWMKMNFTREKRYEN